MSLELIGMESGEPGFRGQWQPLFYKPDIASPQRYLVGVVTQQGGAVKASRVLSDFRKLECIYGERLTADTLRHFFDRLRDQLRETEKTQGEAGLIVTMNPQLTLGEPMYAAGDDAGAAADDLFNTMVVLQPTAEEMKRAKRQFVSRDTETVRRQVNIELQKILELRYDDIVEERGYIDHKEGEIEHRLNINLKTPEACGSVISAWYATASSVEAQLLRAEVDLYKSRDLYRAKRLGLFIQRPLQPSGIAREELKAIDRLIDAANWRFSKPNRVDVHETPAELAEAIADYMGT